MPTNVMEFALALRQFVEKKLPEEVMLFHQKVAAEAFTQFVLRNPVDTGRSRANWQAGTQPNDDFIPNREGFDPARVITEGLEAVQQIQPFTTFFLWNNTVYITELEMGSSTQAPAGFVALTLAEIEGIFR